MSVVDDYGRTDAHPTLLRSACYPLIIDKVSEKDVKKHLTECEKKNIPVINELKPVGTMFALDVFEHMRLGEIERDRKSTRLNSSH